MTFLSDEGVERHIVERRREDGHAVLYAAEMSAGSSDEDVLTQAEELGAPLITTDKDTGRNTFSAAQNFINRVERWTDAIFVGEPSYSRPNFSGEETNLVLPFSRVRGSVSTMYWQDSDPDDVRRWIAPQVPVALSSADYFGNHDPALAAILQIIVETR